MADAIQRGITSPQLQRATGKYSPTSGFTFDQEWRGLDPDQMQALAYQYSAAGCEYELTVQYGMATLRTTDSRGNVTIDTWQIAIDLTLISTFKNPRNVANILPVDLAVMAFAEEQGLNLTNAAAQLNDDPSWKALYSPGDVVVAPTSDTALRLWERVTVFKEDSTFYDFYSVRHETNVNNRYPYNIADFNKNCLYTPAQFASEVRSSSFWIFPMPQAFINVLNSNTPPDGPPTGFKNNGFYLWSYLKGGSARGTAANNRITIVTEYKQALWSTDEYQII